VYTYSNNSNISLTSRPMNSRRKIYIN